MILERELRAGEQASPVGDEYLPRPGEPHDPRRLVYHDPPDSAADDLDLADVDARPHLQPLRLGSAHDRRCAMKRGRGRREGREEAVAGRVDLPSAVAFELRARRLEMLGQKVAPAGVAHARRERRRVDEVGEQQRDEHAAVDPRGKAGEGADAGPFDLDELLVADRPTVVPRRDVEDVLGAELELRPVRELDAETTRKDHPEVPRLAPVASDRRAHAVVPAPPRLVDEVADRDVSEIDHAHGDEGKLDDLVRLAEVLDEVLRHAPPRV